MEIVEQEKIVNNKYSKLQEYLKQRLDTVEANLNQKLNTVEANLNQKLDNIDTNLGKVIDLMSLILQEMIETEGDSYYQSQNYPQAIAYYEKAIKLGSVTGAQKLAKVKSFVAETEGDIHYQSQNYPQAIVYYEQAIKLGSESASEKLAHVKEKPIIELGNDVTIEFLPIFTGTLQVGVDKLVTIKPFLLGTTPVTQAQWRAVAELPKVEMDLDPDPSFFKSSNNPVECVSWLECQEFCARLTEKTRKICRLPSETEWEYVCRAGTKTEYSYGDEPALLGNFAWYDGNSAQLTHPVATKKSNPWQFYDMHGNVWEWCQDSWHENYENVPDDGRAWVDQESIRFVLRGGSWRSNPVRCRSSYRSHNNRDNRNDSIGFRLALSLPRNF
ncbi:SUMF1/EgtB/PvdO family nonheme iron enzyme [Gloeocapsa sp. PCC 73106]|uniref:SUMF1/EgtB/PvdO family nonheme iron enzyme n=1 Tax=Gloeocapsa sp. PCC 73106 TaxID=102232 RepID=UPI0002ACF73F|nr:SUMF1/EgtB/PvdO family nonheme iron enzyme [Gloeocapsa sp. PCC 73106]ELR97709.1 hypothetical protein GLO73106DRAFT_00015230 [Gloeocapsa sp. PCC 73106]